MKSEAEGTDSSHPMPCKKVANPGWRKSKAKSGDAVRDLDNTNTEESRQDIDLGERAKSRCKRSSTSKTGPSRERL